MSERCFNCGMLMRNGVCPECGYQYPFAFECQFHKGITCTITKKPCVKAEQYHICNTWLENS